MNDSSGAPGQQDPTTRHPQPDFAQQDQRTPGWTGPMDPPPDHGEDSYRGRGLLKERKVLLTGGDSGIGRAVAIAFAREGADILFTHLPEEADEARETARLVEDAGRKAIAVPCDIREEAQCRNLVVRAVEEFGRIDVLINNAAYQMSQPGAGAPGATPPTARSRWTGPCRGRSRGRRRAPGARGRCMSPTAWTS
ncbi:hypothetical protein SALBM135S_04032 [Streptomyces alboniger]